MLYKLLPFFLTMFYGHTPFKGMKTLSDRSASATTSFVLATSGAASFLARPKLGTTQSYKHQITGFLAISGVSRVLSDESNFGGSKASLDKARRPSLPPSRFHSRTSVNHITRRGRIYRSTRDLPSVSDSGNTGSHTTEHTNPRSSPIVGNGDDSRPPNNFRYAAGLSNIGVLSAESKCSPIFPWVSAPPVPPPPPPPPPASIPQFEGDAHKGSNFFGGWPFFILAGLALLYLSKYLGQEQTQQTRGKRKKWTHNSLNDLSLHLIPPLENTSHPSYRMSNLYTTVSLTPPILSDSFCPSRSRDDNQNVSPLYPWMNIITSDNTCPLDFIFVAVKEPLAHPPAMTRLPGKIDTSTTAYRPDACPLYLSLAPDFRGETCPALVFSFNYDKKSSDVNRETTVHVIPTKIHESFISRRARIMALVHFCVLAMAWTNAMVTSLIGPILATTTRKAKKTTEIDNGDENKNKKMDEESGLEVIKIRQKQISDPPTPTFAPEPNPPELEVEDKSTPSIATATITPKRSLPRIKIHPPTPTWNPEPYFPDLLSYIYTEPSTTTVLQEVEMTPEVDANEMVDMTSPDTSLNILVDTAFIDRILDEPSLLEDLVEGDLDFSFELDIFHQGSGINNGVCKNRDEGDGDELSERSHKPKDYRRRRLRPKQVRALRRKRAEEMALRDAEADDRAGEDVFGSTATTRC